MAREYQLYCDGVRRSGFVAEPPEIWRQHMPPVEIDVDAERDEYEAIVGPKSMFEIWLAAKNPAYQRLLTEFKAEMQAMHRRVYSTFEQWLDYRYAVKCATLRIKP
jgi:hypothetical protein